MTVAQRLAGCKSGKEVIGVMDKAGREELSRWKKGVLETALEHWVGQHLGPRWRRQQEAVATPWVCLDCGPRDSRQVKRNGHYRRQLVVTEGVIQLRVPLAPGDAQAPAFGGVAKATASVLGMWAEPVAGGPVPACPQALLVGSGPGAHGDLSQRGELPSGEGHGRAEDR